MDVFFFVRYYVDDGILVEVRRCISGDPCFRPSASLASDHFRLFGDRDPTDPHSPAKKIPSTGTGYRAWQMIR